MDHFHLDLGPGGWLLFIVAGIFTGIINTLAGSGSLITLPIFIFFCGLPPTVANGTNRIGVLIQSLVGTYSFYRQGKLPLANLWPLLLTSGLGAYVGSRIAAGIDETLMNYTIGGLMVFMLGVLLVSPKRWLRESGQGGTRNHRPLSLLIFFLIGIYGGFIQAGVGIFLLAALVLLAGYSLVEANAIKLLAVLFFNLPALWVFWENGQVHLGYGLLMAVFQSIGAWLGVRFAARVPRANVWIHRLLILIVVVSASKMLGLWEWLGG